MLAGCAQPPEKPPAEKNPFDDGYLPGMVNTYQTSKEKINNAVEKENSHLQKSLEEGK